MVLATTIDKYCYINCRYLPPFFEHKHRIVYSNIENVENIENINHPSVRAVLSYFKCKEGLEIHHDGDLPARSGLGSSSSFTVGLINAIKALNGKYISKEELAKEAINIEQNVINECVGSQDQISAAFGGFNHIEFMQNDTFQVRPIILKASRLNELNDHLMLFFTGLSRNAPEIAQSQISNFKKRETELMRMKDIVNEAISILESENEISVFGKLLHESWLNKRSLSDRVSNSEIDNIYDVAMQNGAVGGKLLGAGGGGFILFFVPPDQKKNVAEKLKHLVHVPFQFESMGSRIVLYQPNGL